jgi:hypothetical protein
MNQWGIAQSVVAWVKPLCGCSLTGRIGAVQVSGKGSTPFARSMFGSIVRFIHKPDWLKRVRSRDPQSSSPVLYLRFGQNV